MVTFSLLLYTPGKQINLNLMTQLNTNNSPLKDSSQLSESEKALSVSDEEQSSVSEK